MSHTNSLIHETSPYLLQHAHNPVDWLPWGDEALAKAKKENKPILVSIGYSTCHWCHVMERESFEDEEIATFMNRHFINIKVDREERPDIDSIYMAAIQVLSGSGGWPLNCFLTPDLKPFYGGTYFPPTPKYGRASWLQVLQGVSEAYSRERDVVEKQADRLLDYIKKSDNQFIENNIKIAESEVERINPVMMSNIFETMKLGFDREEGGFGSAPKFPGTMALSFLLDYSHLMKDDEALNHVKLSLDKMIAGGIYDQLGGGFARYSTDVEWLAPHFEKMLYDNGLLVSLLADIYALTKDEKYKETIHETLEWVKREMLDDNGGFYSALDADSEGEEGTFYIWDKLEIDKILGDDAVIFNTYFDVTEEGNWEGKNILRRRISLEELAMKGGMETLELKKLMSRWKKLLFWERENRIRPGLDDKVLLDWNALMCKAFIQAYKITGEEEYKQIAQKNIGFIYREMKNGEGFFHSFRGEKAKQEAFLDDYAFLIDTLISYYEITFEICYLNEAKRLVDYVITHFYDENDNCFFFVGEGKEDLLLRKKELYDNATPSGNAVMMSNLLRLSIFFDEKQYHEIAKQGLEMMAGTLEKYPLSFGKWSHAAQMMAYPVKEVAILGEESFSMAKRINTSFIPNKVLMATLEQEDSLPLLDGRYKNNETLIYLCNNYECRAPISTVLEFFAQIES